MRRRVAAGLAIVAAIAGQLRAPASQPTEPPALVGGVALYTVVTGDSLAGIGARAGVEPSTLAADNQIDPRRPLVPGRQIVIDNRHLIPEYVGADSLLLNIPQRLLFVGGSSARTEGFPVAVGSPGWRTPLGPFRVVLTEKNPTWDVPESIHEEARRQGRSLPRRVPPGPDNPLGAYWIGLSIGGIGIHGTNAPSSIYRAVTHGCIRMGADDIARVFLRVKTGTEGRIIYAPVLLSVQDGRVFVESHRDVYRRGGEPHATLRALAAARGVSERIDWAAADAAIDRREGVARDVTRLLDEE